MKIPELPQIEFDEFPKDENTKACIFTQPRYPVPDLTKCVTNGRKLTLFCTATTINTMGRIKDIPFELFQLLPDGNKWLRIDNRTVEGLNTPFGIACLPTGSVLDSVMLLILPLFVEPKRLILYTGSFNKCHEVLISDLYLNFKGKITDLYVDNTLASSKHVEIESTQEFRACKRIETIVEKFPGYRIHLQMGVFDSLDLLVALARHQQFNVKLNLLQQTFFYKSQYKHLFKYNDEIKNSKELNKKFPFGDRPKISIVPIESSDLNTYEKYFNQDKIVNIRLIASEREIDFPSKQHEGSIHYVSYAAHAGAFVLSQLIHDIRPQRVHPIVDSELPEELSNGVCEIVNDFELNRTFCEVTLNDIKPVPKQRSFLQLSTILQGTNASTMEIVDAVVDIQGSTENNISQRTESSGKNDVVEIIDISDDEPITVDAMCNNEKNQNHRKNISSASEMIPRKRKQIQSREEPLPKRFSGESESHSSGSEFVFMFPDE